MENTVPYRLLGFARRRKIGVECASWRYFVQFTLATSRRPVASTICPTRTLAKHVLRMTTSKNSLEHKVLTSIGETSSDPSQKSLTLQFMIFEDHRGNYTKLHLNTQVDFSASATRLAPIPLHSRCHRCRTAKLL